MPLMLVLLIALNLVGFENDKATFYTSVIIFLFMIYTSSLIHNNKTYYSRSSAVWLSIWFPGLGQFYLKQRVLGVIFFALFPIGLYAGIELGYSIGDRFLYLSVLTMLSAVFAYMSQVKEGGSASANTLQQQAVEKYQALTPLLQKGVAPALDTNVLMHDPLVLIALFRDSNAPLWISKQVFNELDGLKKNDNQSVKKRAQMGFDVIELFQSKNRLKLLDVPSYNSRERYGLSHSGDDRIAASYLNEIEKNQTPLVFYTNDKGARIIARSANLAVLELDGKPLKAAISGATAATKASYKTGLAKKRSLTDWRSFRLSNIYFPRIGALIKIGIAAFAINWLYGYIEDRPAVEGSETEQPVVWESPAFPFEELEVTDVKIEDAGERYRIEYEIINHGEDTIVLGYVAEDPEAERSIFRFTDYPDAITTKFHDGSEVKSMGGPEIEPKEKESMIFFESEPIDNLKSISMKIQHTGTGEVVDWSIGAK
ncbi:PIN domain-containing protein [Planococcus salinus]|uniref:PIN domain-containing protein n=1 Tax=Planococcus salinus TaxID=1848460 RepID=A0A3M8P3I3_9BACL|nr:PIN domain-containing protein [Planococcus salinus]RNF38263.1 hypothetical protein EEX84_15490 [Planococcus salinus]